MVDACQKFDEMNDDRGCGRGRPFLYSRACD